MSGLATRDGVLRSSNWRRNSRYIPIGVVVLDPMNAARAGGSRSWKK